MNSQVLKSFLTYLCHAIVKFVFLKIKTPSKKHPNKIHKNGLMININETMTPLEANLRNEIASLR